MNEKLLAKLNSLENIRQPFNPLIKDVIGSIATQYSPTSDDGIVLEIGAGMGKLTEWLPNIWRERLIRSDIDYSACLQLSTDKNTLGTINADAIKLPFTDNSLSAVTGLCVCDVIPNGEALAKELYRTLQSDAPFVHFADMSVAYSFTLRELLGNGLMPVLLKPLEQPELSQLDLLVCSRQHFQALVALLRRQKHLTAEALAEYLEWFSSDVNTAHIFMQRLAEDKKFAHYFESAFILLTQWLDENGVHINELLKTAELSTTELYTERLNDWFGDKFTICLNEVLLKEGTANAADNNNLKYRSLCVGSVFEYKQQNYSPLFPSELKQIPKTQTHLQLGLHVFCAKAK